MAPFPSTYPNHKFLFLPILELEDFLGLFVLMVFFFFFSSSMSLRAIFFFNLFRIILLSYSVTKIIFFLNLFQFYS